jgi:hypothetical protein
LIRGAGWISNNFFSVDGGASKDFRFRRRRREIVKFFSGCWRRRLEIFEGIFRKFS